MKPPTDLPIFAYFGAAALGCALSACGPSGGGSGTPGWGSDTQDTPYDADATGTAPDSPPVPTTCATTPECPTGQVCDRARQTCAGCRTAQDCRAGEVCDGGSCQTAAACAGDLQCTPIGMVCDQVQGHCVFCLAAADCIAGGACVGGTCVPVAECGSSLECAAAGPLVCADAPSPAWPPTRTGKSCQECSSAVDCEPMAACHAGFCVEVCAAGGLVCGEIEGIACGACPEPEICPSTGLGCLVHSYGGKTDAMWAVSNDGRYYYSASDGEAGEVTVVDLHDRSSKTLASDVRYIRSIALAGSQLVVGAEDHLFTIPVDGGQTTDLEVGPDIGNFTDIQYDGIGSVIYGRHSGDQPDLPDGIWLIPLTGGAPQQINDVPPRAGGFGEGVYVYTDTATSNAPIYGLDTATGETWTIAQLRSFPLDDYFLVREGYVYWAEERMMGAARLVRSPLHVEGREELLETSVEVRCFGFVDDALWYWAGGLFRMPEVGLAADGPWIVSDDFDRDPMSSSSPPIVIIGPYEGRLWMQTYSRIWGFSLP